VQLATWGYHTCVRLGSGAVRCWGRNTAGQLGDGRTDHQDCSAGDVGWQDCSPVPVAVSGLPDTTEVATGYAHSCARSGSGTVVCWGENDHGQMGDGTSSAATPRVAP